MSKSLPVFPVDSKDYRSLSDKRTTVEIRAGSSPAFAPITQNSYKSLSAPARINNLTQPILAKAFRGELIAPWCAENPELISEENSAAALLEKIKAERAASTGKKAIRKNPDSYFFAHLPGALVIILFTS